MRSLGFEGSPHFLTKPRLRFGNGGDFWTHSPNGGKTPVKKNQFFGLSQLFETLGFCTGKERLAAHDCRLVLHVCFRFRKSPTCLFGL